MTDAQLTEQIAQDPKVKEARSPLTAHEDWHGFEHRERLLDDYRDAVIAATARVMQESAPPVEWRKNPLVRNLYVNLMLAEGPGSTADRLDALCDAVAAVAALHPPAALPDEREPDTVEGFAWVIVDSRSSPSATPLYWCGFHWHNEHLRAVRFVRQRDAEAAIMGLPDGMHLVGKAEQHGWGAALPPAEQERTQNVAESAILPRPPLPKLDCPNCGHSAWVHARQDGGCHLAVGEDFQSCPCPVTSHRIAVYEINRLRAALPEQESAT